MQTFRWAMMVLLLCCGRILPAQQAQLASTLAPVSASKYVPGRVLVRFRPGRTPAVRAAAHIAAGAAMRRGFQRIPELEVVELADPGAMRAALATYRNNPDVLYAEPDYIVHSDVVPNDPFFTLLWGMSNTGQQNGTAGDDIGALQAWALSTGSNSVTVGILDTGINATHPDLVPNLLPGTFEVDGEITDFIGHGTHVAGTIGAVGDNGTGVAGVNWHVSMEPCKFINFDGGTTSGAIACLDFIAGLKDAGMNVIATNNSWGGTEFSFALQDAIRAQMARGILFIAAAGNDGEDNDIHPHFPASYDIPNIISVAATDRDDRLATFSNFGLHSVDLGAPGVNIVSTFGNDYIALSGTSMATPHVTGVAALLKAYQPGLDWRAIKNRILAAGDPSPFLSATATGKRLNAFGAMTCTGKTALARMEPRDDVVTTVAGAHVRLEMLNINCDQPAGPVSVTVQPGGQIIQLLDDGTAPDEAADDGLYTADFIAPDSGSFTLSFPNGEQVDLRVLRAYSFQNVPFAPRAISGTSLALNDDESRAIDLPFPIHFGGNTFQRLYVNSNGYVTLDYAYNSASVLPMPFPTTGSIIAPWWDDWAPHFDSSANVYWAVNGTAPSREIVIEWRQLPYFVMVGPDASGVTFQAVFFEDKDDVLFNYIDVDIVNTFVDISGGGAGSVGIQIGPTAGTQFSFIPFFFNPADPAPLKNGMSLLWQPAPVDFSLSVNPVTQTAYPGNTASFPVTLTSLFGFTNSATVTCTGAAPASCTGGTLSPSPFGSALDVQASDITPGTYTFGIHAENTQFGVIHEQQVSLKVVDFQLSAPSPALLSIPDHSSSSFTFQANAAGPFSSNVSLSCSKIAGITCSFSPTATVAPTAALPVNVTATVTISAKTAPGTYNLQVFGTADGATRQITVPVTVTANPDFFLTTSATDVGADAVNATAVSIVIDAEDGYTGNVQLSCSVAPAGPSCSITPTGTLALPQNAVLTIAGSNSPVGNYQVTVTGSDGTRTHAATVNYRVGPYTITGPGPIATFGGIVDSRLFTVAWTGTPNAQLTFQCFAPAPAVCFPPQGFSTANATSPSQVQVQFGVNGPAPSFTMTLVLLENGVPVRSLTIPATAQGFTLTAGPRVEQTVAVGQASAPFDLTVTPWGGYDLPTNVQICSIGCITETVTPNGQPLAVPFTVSPPIDSRFPFSDNVFNVQASADTPSGTIHETTDPNAYTLHTQDVWLVPSVTSVVLAPGASTSLTVTAKSSNGLVVPVQLGCPDTLGADMICSFDKTTINPGESATLTLATTAATPPSFRAVTVTGTATVAGQVVTRTASIRTDLGRVTFELRNPVITVPEGGEALYIIDTDLSFLGDEFFTATVTCDTPDAGITCEPPSSIVVPGSFILPVRTTPGVTTVGAHNVNITITGAGEAHVIPASIVMHGPDSLIVTSPNAEENWPGGLHQIEWTYTGNPGPTVRLELLKNDTLDSVIADNVPVGTNGRGSFDWTIASDALFSQFAKVRIISDTRPDIFDSSDTRFWTGHGAELLSPRGGQIINMNDGGFNAAYTWTGLGAGSFELYKSGVLVQTFQSGGNGYFLFRPPWTWSEFIFPLANLPEGNDYTLRIIPGTDTTRASFNPGGAFSLVRPSVTFSSPQPGQVFQPGDTVTIAWTSHSLPPSDIQLTVNDPAAPFDPLRSITIATVPLSASGAGTVTWKIPANAVPSRGYLVGFNLLGPLAFGVATPQFTIGSFNKLSIVVNGEGFVTSTNPNLQTPISCGVSCDNFLVTGSSITLHASPGVNFAFSGWSGACSGTADCTLVLTADTVLTANFTSTLPDFTFVPQSPAATVQSGSAATYSFSLAALNNFAAPVSFDCSPLPLNAHCSFSPAPLQLGATPATVTLTVSTNGSVGTAAAISKRLALERPTVPRMLAALFASVMALVLARGRRKLLSAVLGVAIALVVVSCGGGGSGPQPPPAPPPATTNTPAGTYVINVTARSQNPLVIHAAQVTLVVK